MWLSTLPVAFPGGFFSVFQLNACAYASVPSETYDQVTQELDFSHAVLGAEKSGEIGVLASPCLSCKPAQIPSLIQPLQIWDAVWTSHWVLASECISGHHWGSDTSVWEQQRSHRESSAEICTPFLSIWIMLPRLQTHPCKWSPCLVVVFPIVPVNWNSQKTAFRAIANVGTEEHIA